ncbi:MAG: hypothetical protein Q9221_007223 [Calogaya cf. arnoldii]
MEYHVILNQPLIENIDPRSHVFTAQYWNVFYPPGLKVTWDPQLLAPNPQSLKLPAPVGSLPSFPWMLQVSFRPLQAFRCHVPGNVLPVTPSVSPSRSKRGTTPSKLSYRAKLADTAAAKLGSVVGPSSRDTSAFPSILRGALNTATSFIFVEAKLAFAAKGIDFPFTLACNAATHDFVGDSLAFLVVVDGDHCGTATGSADH